MITYVGIDIGLAGAIAIIWPSHVEVFDMPVVTGDKNDYDVKALKNILESVGSDRLAIIESLHALFQVRSSSTFSLGRGSGIVEGVLGTLEFPFVKVPPKRWKKVMMEGHSTKDKGESIVVAKRLFPSVDLPRKKDHGKADALLMAEYGRRLYGEL